LQIERRYALDAAVLRKSYLELSRKFHPDRFGQRSIKERRIAVEKSAAINTAYKTLLDPIKRAEYLLAQEAGLRDLERLKADPEVLELVMEKREQISELYAQKNDSAKMALTSLKEEALLEEAKIFASLEKLFTRFDQGDHSTSSEVERIVVWHRYNKGILQETNGALSLFEES
jgi:molecular chaperone HscB